MSTSVTNVVSGTVFIVTLRSDEPGIDAIRSLRALLKLALRRFGLRCTDVKERSA